MNGRVETKSVVPDRTEGGGGSNLFVWRVEGVRVGRSEAADRTDQVGVERCDDFCKG